MHETDFLVVGAGIAGAGIAFQMAPHARVTLIDMEEQAGYHTTGRSAAFYAETYGGAKLQPLTTASKEFLQHPPVGFSGQPVLAQLGAIHVFREDQRSTAEKMFTDKSKTLSGIAMLSAEQVHARAPYLQSANIAGGIEDPGCGNLDVAALHQGFLKGAKKAGAIVQLGAGFESATFKDGRWIVKTRTGEIRAKTIVNAAGAWGDEIAERAGVKPIGLSPLRRTIVTITNPDGLMFNKDGPIVIDVDEEFYFKPEGAGYLVSPADEITSPPCDAQPELEDVAIAAGLFERASGAAVHRVDAKWAGLRTFASDRTPVIGYAVDNTGFFWNVGQGGYGIQTAPAWSALAGALALHQPVPQFLLDNKVQAELYNPARFSS